MTTNELFINMKKKIHETTVEKFRTNFKAYGYTEKNSELNSGGDLKPDFLTIMDSFVKEWYEIDKKYKGCKLTFTSGNDNFHQGITKYTSRHTKGEAIDIVLPEHCHASFKNLLNQYKFRYNGFNYLDEYTNPTSLSSGGHFHISYRQGDPEGSSKDNGQTTTSSSDVATTSGSTTQLASSVPSSDEDVKKAYQFMKPLFLSLEPVKKQMQGKLTHTESFTSDSKIINEVERIKDIMKL